MFKELSELLDSCDLHIVLKKKNDKITISTVPLNPKGAHMMVALTMTGTPDELDQQYIMRLKEPVSTAVGLQSNEAEVKKDLTKKSKDAKTTPPPAHGKAVPEPKKEPKISAEEQKKLDYAKQVEELAKKEGLSGHSGDLFAEKPPAVEVNDVFELEDGSKETNEEEIDDDF